MLKLYKKILPNIKGGLHYYFTSKSQYIESLGNPYMELENDNYRINSGILTITTSNIFVDVNEITYIADIQDTYTRFYFVDYAEILSGFISMSLSLDMWGTFFDLAIIDKIRVNRCNRNIGIGVYDNIQVTQGVEYEQLNTTVGTIDLSNLALVFTAVYNTGVSTIISNNAATALGTFVIRLNDLEPATQTPLDWAVEAISGIYSVQGTITDFDAAVLNAYIVPYQTLGAKSGTVPIFKSKTTSLGDLTITPDFVVAPFTFPIAFDVSLDPNYNYYFGTKLAGLKLIRTTETTIRLYCNFIAKQDGIQVIVKQGDQALDITDAFSVGLTSNDGNFTTAQRISRGIQMLGGIASSGFQIASGGAGVVTGAMGMVSALQGIIETGNAKYTPGGDGINTFRLLSGTVDNGLYFSKFKSIDDEQAHARLYGASYNVQLESLENIFEYALIGSGTMTDTYIALNCNITGVCSQAMDDIKMQLENGVYMVKL